MWVVLFQGGFGAVEVGQPHVSGGKSSKSNRFTATLIDWRVHTRLNCYQIVKLCNERVQRARGVATTLLAMDINMRYFIDDCEQQRTTITHSIIIFDTATNNTNSNSNTPPLQPPTNNQQQPPTPTSSPQTVNPTPHRATVATSPARAAWKVSMDLLRRRWFLRNARTAL